MKLIRKLIGGVCVAGAIVVITIGLIVGAPIALSMIIPVVIIVAGCVLAGIGIVLIENA